MNEPMLYKKQEIKFDIGQQIIARDPHWGHYAGIVKQVRDVRGELQVDVEILACLKHPSQVSILYADVPFRRKAYLPGSIHVFNFNHVR